MRACEVDPPRRVAASSVRRAPRAPEIVRRPSRVGPQSGVSRRPPRRDRSTRMSGTGRPGRARRRAQPRRLASGRARGSGGLAACARWRSAWLVARAAAAAAGGRAATGGWRWPLAPPPRVVRAVPRAARARSARATAASTWPARRVPGARGGRDGVVAFAGRVAGVGVVSVDHRAACARPTSRWPPRWPAASRVARGQVLGLLAGSGGHCPPAACLHWGLRRGADLPRPADPARPVAAPVRLLPVWSAERPASAGRAAGSGRSASRAGPAGVPSPAPPARTPAGPGTGERVVAGAAAIAALGGAVLLGRPARDRLLR